MREGNVHTIHLQVGKNHVTSLDPPLGSRRNSQRKKGIQLETIFLQYCNIFAGLLQPVFCRVVTHHAAPLKIYRCDPFIPIGNDSESL